MAILAGRSVTSGAWPSAKVSVTRPSLEEDVQLTTLAYVLVSCSVSLHASQSGVFSGTGRPVLTTISIVGGDWEVRLIFIVSTDVSSESVPPRRSRSRTSAPTRIPGRWR